MTGSKNNQAITTTKLSPLAPVTIQELDNIDRSILNVVKEGFRRATEVMDGNRKWSTVQFRIWQTCLNKLRPDLKTTQLLIDDQRKPIDEMSREEVFIHMANLEAAKAAKDDEAQAKLDDKSAPPVDAEFVEIAPKVGVPLNED